MRRWWVVVQCPKCSVLLLQHHQNFSTGLEKSANASSKGGNRLLSSMSTPPQTRRLADEAGWSCHCLQVDEGRDVGHRRGHLDGDVEPGLCGKLIGLAANAAGALVLLWPPALCRL